ncbi:MAG: hypothetical protein LDL15_01070 [Yonghaparkia sp.]|nr:hypothetical protein [Microcella sp.]
MPRRLRLAVAPLVLLIATLTACAEPTRLPPPEEPAARAPLFASDEEALAAATEAYEEYLAVSNAVFAKPPRDIDRLLEVATPEFVEAERSIAERFDANNWTVAGGTELVTAELQQWFREPSGLTYLVAYMCVDVSTARILDEAGQDVTPVGRPNNVTLEVTMRGSSVGEFMLEKSELWQEVSACD